MQKHSEQLESKVCQNCLETYQKFEQSELRLEEATRKVGRLEAQVSQQEESGAD